jgi:hypothetical protein
MKESKQRLLAVSMCAGLATGLAHSNDGPVALGVSHGQVEQVAHIYFNMATGEQVVTLLDDGQTEQADNGVSGPIWSSLVGGVCADQGFTTAFFFGFDDNSPTSMGGPPTSLASGAEALDWGDIAIDTVVDCVLIGWVTDHIDVDADSDGIGDGVVGLAGQWTWYDADNGRVTNQSTRLPLIRLVFTDLPGDTSGTDDPNDPANTLAGYTATIDLAATFTSSLVFELGDSDGDLQGAAVANNDVDTDSDGIGDGVSVAAPGVDRDFDGNDDSDLDGDTLFDFSYGTLFFQPGTGDFDDDGVFEGDLSDGMRTIGVTFGSPAGTAVDNGDGSWTWEIDTSVVDAGTGAEDAFSLYLDDIHAGIFNFGGFSCTPDGNGQPTPRADFSMQLFGPGNIDTCRADLTGDGSLNFFDISAFLAAFGDQDPVADFTEDGNFNFFDISTFLGEFGDGCP